MDNVFDELTAEVALRSRRWITRGALGAALAGLVALRDEDDAAARKKRKGKKNKRCRGNARRIPECVSGEDQQWCVPAEGNPRVCCPQNRIYAVCPNEAIVGGECTAPEAQAPDVCCPADKVCGSRCCEKPFGCVNAAASQCSGAPPTYARIRRRR